MILGNCAIYSITSRLVKLAVLAAGKTLYYAYGRVIMASTCFLGVRPGKAAVKELTQPKVASLVLATCAAEAVYMLALYQAFACISPVYVTAIKRGGGVLLASHGGVLESRPNSKKRPLFTISRGHDTPRRPATRIKRPRHAKPPQVLRVDVLLQGAAGGPRLPDRGDRGRRRGLVPLSRVRGSIRFHVVAAAALRGSGLLLASVAASLCFLAPGATCGPRAVRHDARHVGGYSVRRGRVFLNSSVLLYASLVG